jgi:hypothetical protein
MSKAWFTLAAVFTNVILLTAAVQFAACQSATVSPEALIRRTVDNEIKSNTDGGKFMFCDHKHTPHGDETKLLIETQEATAGLVIARNGRPLSAEERQTELAREQRFVSNPAELRKKISREQEDREHTIQIIKALPDAFLYEAAGTEPGNDGMGKVGDDLVRLNFHPNPRYIPPSRVEQVLTAMQGHVLIDATQNRIARIDGTLSRDVEFGWGILGRLDQGGHFLVEQSDEGGGKWELTHMNLQFQGRLLLVKKLLIESEETFANFRSVPANLTFSEGLHMLQTEEARINQHDEEAKSK